MSTKNRDVRFSISMPAALREKVGEIADQEKRTLQQQLNYYIELGMKAENEGMRLLEKAS